MPSDQYKRSAHDESLTDSDNGSSNKQTIVNLDTALSTEELLQHDRIRRMQSPRSKTVQNNNDKD